jgi:hypothetical protein
MSLAPHSPPPPTLTPTTPPSATSSRQLLQFGNINIGPITLPDPLPIPCQAWYDPETPPPTPNPAFPTCKPHTVRVATTTSRVMLHMCYVCLFVVVIHSCSMQYNTFSTVLCERIKGH